MKPDAQRLIELQRLLQDLTHVERRVYRKRGEKLALENDTEHSYNLAMTAWYLSSWFPELNKENLITFALAHDMVEVHAGDTYVYGTPEELASKTAREQQAALKLRQDWPDFDSLHRAIDAYEQKSSPEARFIYALDKIMPMMVIYINEGYNWKKNKISVEMLRDSKDDKVRLSPEILPYYDKLIELLLDHPELIQPR